MADLGYIDGKLRGLSDDVSKRILLDIFTHLVKSGIAIGEPVHQTRSKNLTATFLTSTTATSTGEFSIVHGLESAPQYAIPVVDLQQAGAQLVPLRVTRAADARRVYLQSTSTRASFVLLVG
jgi:hypothetical protein